MRSSFLSVSELPRKRVAVLGFGRAGRYTVSYLLAHGSVPTVYTPCEVPPETRAAYEARGVCFRSPFPTCFAEEVLVRSPGIRPDIPSIVGALANGATLTGECDLFLANTRATVIGVTGSDGKTTTANMIAALLQAAGKRAVLGGNNGAPLLSHLDTLGAEDLAVVELSSFQLMTAPAPDIAVITNIVPNHLNWHVDLAEYVRAKCRIFEGASRLVINAAQPCTRKIGLRAGLPVTWFGTDEMSDAERFVRIKDDDLIIKNEFGCRTVSVFRDFALLGKHNRENLAAAVAAVCDMVDDVALLRVARTFRGVPHRLEHVATVKGIAFINSSIDTSPSRTVAALNAVEGRPLVIVGGRGKGVSLAPLCEALVSHARAVYAYGDTAREIAAGIDGRVPCNVQWHFANAFGAACADARAGDTVLLSPGCTAFGEFRDFEERGETFCRLVKKWEEERKQSSGTS